MEKYYLDGVLIDKLWSLKPSSIREFDVGGQSVRVEYKIARSEYYSKLYVNDKLHIEELFPELKKKYEERKLNKKKYNWKVIVGIFFVSMVLAIAYKTVFA